MALLGQLLPLTRRHLLRRLFRLIVTLLCLVQAVVRRRQPLLMEALRSSHWLRSRRPRLPPGFWTLFLVGRELSGVPVPTGPKTRLQQTILYQNLKNCPPSKIFDPPILAEHDYCMPGGNAKGVLLHAEAIWCIADKITSAFGKPLCEVIVNNNANLLPHRGGQLASRF